MKQITKGVEFERELTNSLKDVAVLMGDSLPVFLLPDSGKAAAKKKMSIGDLVVCRGFQSYFIDCTSCYERSDSPGSFRLTTAKKDIKKFYDYATSIEGTLLDKLLSYLDDTFDYPKPVELPTIEDRGSVYVGEVDLIEGPWHNCGSATFVFAFKYDEEIYFIPLNKFTFPMLDKSDPNIEPLLKFAFNLPGFVDYALTGSVASVGSTHPLDYYVDITEDDVYDDVEIPVYALLLHELKKVYGTIEMTKRCMVINHNLTCQPWSCREYGFDCDYVHSNPYSSAGLEHIQDEHPEFYAGCVAALFGVSLKKIEVEA